MKLETITRHGKRFVLVPESQYVRLASEFRLPALPPVDSEGTSNAIDFARATIARRLITDRRAARLSQQQLSALSGVRQETISRIESGKQTATIRIIDKLESALKAASAKSASPRRRIG